MRPQPRTKNKKGHDWQLCGHSSVKVLEGDRERGVEREGVLRSPCCRFFSYEWRGFENEFLEFWIPLQKHKKIFALTSSAKMEIQSLRKH